MTSVSREKKGGVIMQNSSIEMIAMNIIAYSGDARSFAFRALEKAKSGDFHEAEHLLKSAHESSTKAHQTQTELLVEEANDKKIEMSVLLIHAQDHFMTSMLALELIEEIVLLYKKDRK